MSEVFDKGLFTKEMENVYTILQQQVKLIEWVKKLLDESNAQGASIDELNTQIANINQVIQNELSNVIYVFEGTVDELGTKLDKEHIMNIRPAIIVVKNDSVVPIERVFVLSESSYRGYEVLNYHSVASIFSNDGSNLSGITVYSLSVSNTFINYVPRNYSIPTIDIKVKDLTGLGTITITELQQYDFVRYNDKLYIKGALNQVGGNVYNLPFIILNVGSIYNTGYELLKFEGTLTQNISIGNVGSFGLTTSTQFEELVAQTPTLARLVDNEGQLQLQLEHDSNVLDIDTDFMPTLGKYALLFDKTYPSQYYMYYGVIYLSSGNTILKLTGLIPLKIDVIVEGIEGLTIDELLSKAILKYYDCILENSNDGSFKNRGILLHNGYSWLLYEGSSTVGESVSAFTVGSYQLYDLQRGEFEEI